MTKKLSPEIKAEICTHFEHGMSQIQIALKYHITQATVSKTLKRYAQRETYARKHGSGRPPKLTKKDLEFFEDKIEEIPN
jgi:transposase